MVNKDEQVALWVECLKMRFSVMTNREKRFAKGVIDFYENQGWLSDKQANGARKLAVRLICERDPFFLY